MDDMYTVVNVITADVSLVVSGVVTSVDATISANISLLEMQFTVSFDWLSTVFSDSVIGLQTGMDAAVSDASSVAIFSKRSHSMVPLESRLLVVGYGQIEHRASHNDCV